MFASVDAAFKERQIRLVDLFRSFGFRRVGNTEWFAYAKGREHPSRYISASKDCDPTSDQYDPRGNSVVGDWSESTTSTTNNVLINKCRTQLKHFESAIETHARLFKGSDAPLMAIPTTSNAALIMGQIGSNKPLNRRFLAHMVKTSSEAECIVAFTFLTHEIERLLELSDMSAKFDTIPMGLQQSVMMADKDENGDNIMHMIAHRGFSRLLKKVLDDRVRLSSSCCAGCKVC